MLDSRGQSVVSSPCLQGVTMATGSNMCIPSSHIVGPMDYHDGSPQPQRPSCALAGRTSLNSNSSVSMETDDSFEDVDEDDISDDEECYNLRRQFIDQAKQNNEADNLLNFADKVNKDIKKFFGQKKDPDSCNIYEDRWSRGKSGRELYYADLLRIAQGEEAEDKYDKNYTGIMDKKVGLGPLKDLFELGIQAYLSDNRLKEHIKPKRTKAAKNLCKMIPMKDRNLPRSFWKEPVCVNRNSKEAPNGVANTHGPDFTDLLESWTGIEHHNGPVVSTSR